MIDTNYISVYGLTLIAGRNFYLADTAREGSDAGSVPVQTGYRAFMLNENCSKGIGFQKPGRRPLVSK